MTPIEKPLLAALNGAKTAHPPLWLMRQAGRYLPEFREMRKRKGSFLSLCYDPQAAAEVTIQPLRRFGFDAAILFSDILVVPHALGQKLDFKEGEGPVLDPIRSVGELTKLSPHAALDALRPVLDCVGLLRQRLGQEHPQATLIGFAGAPWTVASYMVEGGTSRDHIEAKRWAIGDPTGFGVLVDLLVEATSSYLVAQAKAGAEALQIFDSWAGALGDADFETFCLRPIAEIVRRVKLSCPATPIIVFARGAGLLHVRVAEIPGVAAVSLDTAVPMAWAAREIDPRVALQGNLDPVALLVGGSALDAHIARIVEAMAGRRHVFNLGHGILPPTPIDHVSQLVARVRRGA
ncbi:MAG: uroporphyrinogen decarboxylase [Alphaproteobacteria bacterium]|nr:uroporphyrinogen decarboxylase [Alphaproteobacteria bacterium]